MSEQETTTSPDAEKPASGLVRLRWLKILRYRNVRPGTVLRFDATRNILLGKNGTGKTTLLKLLAAVISSEFRLLDEPYELEYEVDINEMSLLVRAWTEEPKRLPMSDATAVAFAVRGWQGRELIRFFRVYIHQESSRVRGTFEVDPRGARISIEGQETEDLRDIWGMESPAWQRFASLLGANPPGLELLAVIRRLGLIPWDLGDSVRRFDESLDTFRELTGSMQEGEVLLPPYIIGIRGPRDTAAHLSVAPGSSSAVWRNWASSKNQLTPEDMAVDIQGWPPLNMIGDPLGATNVEMRLCFAEKKVFHETENWRYRLLRFQFTRPDGAIFSHDVLSYGQKRLLAFLYYLSVNDHIVIADELVNGLHHEWIQLCLDQMGERQAFLTSQNPLLLDYLPPGSAEQAQQRYILCRTERTDRGEELIWENMPTAEAERFFRAYSVGIQHVSEVLLSKGLW